MIMPFFHIFTIMGGTRTNIYVVGIIHFSSTFEIKVFKNSFAYMVNASNDNFVIFFIRMD